jgi:septal ring factor EnvC (AmiA/AmiB activator)
MLAFVLAGAVLSAQLNTDAAENPIRRIVNLLQKMQGEVETEAARDKDLSEKFACYCKTNDGELSASLEDLRNKIPQLEASIEESESLKSQLDAELVAHKDTREKAKESIGSATKQREEEAEAFAAESGELKSNIAALKKAISAIAKGMSGEFLQTGAAEVLRKLAISNVVMSGYQRETLTSFLSIHAEYAPAGGEILGILKQLQENMEKELSEITETENGAIADFEGLVAAKEKEIAAATSAIEDKTERAGEVAVQIVMLKNDLSDTKEELGADEVFLMELKKSCAQKAKEYEERVAMRAQEMVAVSETIKILNDDDALDLFKKTMPSPAFLQFTRSASDLRKAAVAALREAKTKGLGANPKMAMLALAIEGKKAGFEKVLKMVDEMVATLKVEQKDDDAQLKWCNEELDVSEDNSKDLKRLIEGITTKISETDEAIKATTEEIATLKTGIKELDEAVAEATESRKAEHAAFVQTAGENNAAVQLLTLAANRLNKFYNPTLYVAPKRRELTEEERIYVNSGGADPRDAEEKAAAAANPGIAGTGVTVFAQVNVKTNGKTKAAPPPPPETVDAYQKKDAGGPSALINKLKNDLEKDIQANEMEEAEAQKDYEEMMAGSAAKRAADTKTLTEKDSQKADLEGDLQAATDAKKAKSSELMALGEYIGTLHGSCDFLIANYDVRKEARASEIDALGKAKAVLSGADYSLMQTSAFLRRRD